MSHQLKPIVAPTFDDLLFRSVERILQEGHRVESTRSENTEIVATHLVLENPRARLSLAESRATVLSCLGEFLWILSGESDISFIEYYIPGYRNHVDVDETTGNVPAAYGPRIFGPHENSQYTKIIAMLKRNPTTKKAVIQIFDKEDTEGGAKDVPCTCTMQFMIRDLKLHMLVSMRSNDVFIGLPHDIFLFTMIQEMVAATLGYPLGLYHHFAGSLHLYQSDNASAKRLMDEGWQQRCDASAPLMPKGDALELFGDVLEAEYAFRTSGRTEAWPNTGSEYIDQIIDLLHFKSCLKSSDHQLAVRAAEGIRNQYYRNCLDKQIRKLNRRS